MALELKDLSNEERLVLVALIERAVAADGYAGDEEAKRVRKIAEAVGAKAYKEAVEAADQHFTDDEGLWQAIAKVTRVEARELIYEAVFETVIADAPRSGESQILARLSQLWHLKAQIIEPTPRA